MAVVYRVIDDAKDGRVLALKRLIPAEGDKAKLVHTLFEREYHALAQLAHPRVVEVHDYGVDEVGPYYTMELLDGSDVRELSPMPWKQLCSLMRDVCSALSLLHSRRLLHRDLTARNIRVTSDGRAKLIDFGAMTPFGLVREVIGTPPHLAPEVVRGQPLDGRTDLYAFGALFYWLLTGRHAYPARRASALEALWRGPIAPPSQSASDVPRMLDQLVLSLLSLDPDARPSSAAEVAHRLGAIAELPDLAELEVAQSYLTTPRLVGRERELETFRSLLRSPADGRASALVLSAQAGLGRTRLLASCALEAKLAGAVVAQVDATTCTPRSLDAVRALLEGLAVAPDVRDLAPPQLRAWFESRSAIEPAQAALHAVPAVSTMFAFLERVAETQPVVLLVDEVQRLDAASSSFLVELYRLSIKTRVVVVVSVNSDQVTAPARDAIEALLARAQTLQLAPLQEAMTRELLRSVFGDADNLKAVAHWAQRVGEGRPRVTMELAQHLVDRGIARHRAGHWQLPEDLSVLDLPENLEQVMQARVAGLGAAAREVGLTLALLDLVALEPLSVEHCAQLLSDRLSAGQFFAGLDELIAAGFMVLFDGRHAFASATHCNALASSASDEVARGIHARIAEFCASGPDELQQLAPYHFRHAGRLERAFELLAVPLPEEMSLDNQRVRIARGPAGLSIFHWAIDYIKQHRVRPLQAAHVYASALKLAAVADPSLSRCAEDALARFVYDSGRDLFENIDPQLPAAERLQQAFAGAQQRWAVAPDAERGLSPAQGIEQLALAVATLGATYVRTLDPRGGQTLAALVEPFRVFPAVAIVHELADMCAEWGLGNEIRARRLAALQALAAPVPAMGEVTRQGAINICIYYCGLEEANLGDALALERAAYLEKQPFYTALGWDVRAQYYQRRGMAQELAVAREQRALAALREADADQHRMVGGLFELPAMIQTEDLMGLSSMMQRLESDARAYPGWAPVLEYAIASRQAMVGDAAASLARFETALRLGPLGACAVGDLFADGYLRALLQVGAVERAASDAASIEARITELELRPMHARMLDVTFALCQARHGHTAAARERLMRQLAVIDAAGQRGLPRGNLHEALACIAMIEGDRGRCDAHVQNMGDEFRPGGLPGLVARHERLQAAVRRHWNRATSDAIDAAAVVSKADGSAPANDPVTAVELAEVVGVRRASRPPEDENDS